MLDARMERRASPHRGKKEDIAVCVCVCHAQVREHYGVRLLVRGGRREARAMGNGILIVAGFTGEGPYLSVSARLVALFPLSSPPLFTVAIFIRSKKRGRPSDHGRLSGSWPRDDGTGLKRGRPCRFGSAQPLSVLQSQAAAPTPSLFFPIKIARRRPMFEGALFPER